MKKWKTILIDDEQLARQRLKRLLSAYPGIEIIGEAENGSAALEMINVLHPDLLFLDIEMPVLNGFEMLARLDLQPRIVFTTAYDQYAIRAFEENSVDYLLKPVEAGRLEKTIAKLDSLDQSSTPVAIEKLLSQIQRQTELRTLTVKTGDRIVLLKIADLSFAQADEKYVFLYTTDGKKYLTDYTITSLEEKLPDVFVRIHRACIINSEQITEIRKGFNGVFNFIMNGFANQPVSSSRSYAELLKTRFDI
ncbi:MAG: LytTR family transcriptional regulator DNA-binding domain-containing protein [Chitinophagaceae bacterium]